MRKPDWRLEQVELLDIVASIHNAGHSTVNCGCRVVHLSRGGPKAAGRNNAPFGGEYNGGERNARTNLNHARHSVCR
jgi:hypothetical protein